MQKSRHYRPLSILFSLSSLALFGVVVLQSQIALGAQSMLLPEGGRCGDGYRQSGEECDLGQYNGACGVSDCSKSCKLNRSDVCKSSGSSNKSTSSQAKAVCGNGVLEKNETCDDGNKTNGDGCNASCKAEKGFSCSEGRCVSLCGNRRVDSGEKCDDGNRTPGDGCNASCKVESGYTCVNTDTSVCTPKPKCGNGIKEGTEQCDLGPNNGPSTKSDCSTSCKLNKKA